MKSHWCMRSLRLALVLAPAYVLSTSPTAASRAAEAPAAAAEPAKISFWTQVRPILQEHCQGCHQPAKPLGGLVLTTAKDLLKGGESQHAGVVAGKPDESPLIQQIVSQGGEPPAMPKVGDPLSAADVATLRGWVEQGAIDDSPAREAAEVDQAHPPVYQLPPVIAAIDYSPDSQLLAVTGYHEILLHKADGSELLARLVGLSERVQSLAFSPDGKLLAAVGGSPGRFGEVQIWDVASRELKLSKLVTYDTLYGVSWTPDGTRVAFGCGDNTLRALDISNGKQILYQGAHGDWVLDTVFSTDASHLVSVSRDRSVKLTEVATERFVDNITSITPGALKGGLLTVDRHPTKDEVVIGGADGTPKIYQLYRTKPRQIGDDFNLIRQFDPLPGRLFSAEFNADGSRFVVGASDSGTSGEARVYQTDDGKLVCRLEGERGPVYAVAFRPDGQQVASAGFEGLVRLNDAATGKLIKEFVAVPLATAVAAGK